MDTDATAPAGQATTRSPAEPESAAAAPEAPGWVEWATVILLSVTTILAAWSAFQASKWSGLMSISFSEANGARIEAARQDGDANRRISVQVGLFSQWIQARATGETEQAEYLVSVFPEPLATAFDAWWATDPANDPEAPRTPFEMPEYAVPEQSAAAAADQRAESEFAEALANNQRADNYTLLAVLFAAVLFFAALSGRARTLPIRYALLGLGMVLFLAAAGLLIAYPKVV